MMNSMILWATILSPVISAIAVIVALIIANRSTKDAKKQIDAVYDLLGVFIASQNLNIKNALCEYISQKNSLDMQIEDAREDFETIHNPFLYSAPRIEVVEELENQKERKRKLDNLLAQREDIEMNIQIIQSYLEKVKNIKEKQWNWKNVS